MTTLFFDCETFSEADLKAHGTHRYAAHPSTEITVAQWALDDGDPLVCDCTGRRWPPHLIALLEEPTIEVVAQNSMFDRTLLRHCWGLDVPIPRWRDTMVKALTHSLPGGLDKIGAVLGLPDDLAKDKRGRELIQLFCKPRPKNSKLRRATRDTHPKEWAEFLGYSRQDIISMREVDRRLPSWNYKPGHSELALWHLDQKINDRGFAVDVELAQAAVRATDLEKVRLKGAMHAATDGLVSGPSKRDDILAFILAEYGVDLPDMRADTLRRRMEDPELPEGVKLLLSIRLEATKTSTAKYQALLKAVSDDGRLRNTTQFAGALRTTRWAGRIFQPQNMPRPTPDFDEAQQDMGIAALKGGYADVVFGDLMQLTANLVRGCIVAPPGRKLCIADLSNIEGRMLAWLADERWKLKAFADFDAGVGEDLYKLAYARSFNVDPKTATGPKRQIGKVQELALGYEGGVAAFLTFAAVYRMDLDELARAVLETAPGGAIDDAEGVWAWASKKHRTNGLAHDIYVACEVLKKAWRNAHPATVKLWSQAADSVRRAIAMPGVTCEINDKLAARRDGAWLRIRLPSGRYLCYLQPQVSASGQISYMGVNQYTRQWTRISTYGGKLVENITQASARDVMAANMPLVDSMAYDIVLTVHDELLTETDDTDEFSAEELATLLAANPPWGAGLPLAAAGFETYRYRKD